MFGCVWLRNQVVSPRNMRVGECYLVVVQAGLLTCGHCQNRSGRS